MVRLGKLEKKALVSLLRRGGYATRVQLLCDIWPEFEVKGTTTRMVRVSPRSRKRQPVTYRIPHPERVQESDRTLGSCQVQMSRVLDSLERKELVVGGSKGRPGRYCQRKEVWLTKKGQLKARYYINLNI